jgi:hypothetical protein
MASTIRYYSNMKTFIIVIKRTSLFLEMIRAHCELFPGSIQPHPYQCAQYFDCGPTIGGSYLRECKYPQLFDEVSMAKTKNTLCVGHHYTQTNSNNANKT